MEIYHRIIVFNAIIIKVENKSFIEKFFVFEIKEWILIFLSFSFVSGELKFCQILLDCSKDQLGNSYFLFYDWS